jgi:hypothetical protein
MLSSAVLAALIDFVLARVLSYFVIELFAVFSEALSRGSFCISSSNGVHYAVFGCFGSAHCLCFVMGSIRVAKLGNVGM